jgi:hypothetical protein
VPPSAHRRCTLMPLVGEAASVRVGFAPSLNDAGPVESRVRGSGQVGVRDGQGWTPEIGDAPHRFDEFVERDMHGRRFRWTVSADLAGPCRGDNEAATGRVALVTPVVPGHRHLADVTERGRASRDDLLRALWERRLRGRRVRP